MKRIPLVKRKSLLSAGVPNSQLINLAERNDHFKNRMGDTSIFTPADTLLVFIASELLDFLPFRNVSAVVDELVKSYPKLYRLLRQNPKQFLVVEKKPNNEPGIPMSFYLAYPILTEILMLPGWDWPNREAMVLVNLEKIYLRGEDLFLKEGIVISED